MRTLREHPAVPKPPTGIRRASRKVKVILREVLPPSGRFVLDFAWGVAVTILLCAVVAVGISGRIFLHPPYWLYQKIKEKPEPPPYEDLADPILVKHNGRLYEVRRTNGVHAYISGHGLKNKRVRVEDCLLPEAGDVAAVEKFTEEPGIPVARPKRQVLRSAAGVLGRLGKLKRSKENPK